MRIFDYERAADLKDVELVLSLEEAEDLLLTLERLVKQPELSRVYLSDVRGSHIEREISIGIREQQPFLAQTA